MDESKYHHTKKTQATSGSPVRKISKRCIRFDDSDAVIENNSEPLSKSTIESLWWTPEELLRMKKTAKDLSCVVRKIAEDRGCSVAKAFTKTSLMLSSDMKSLVQLTPTTPEQDLFRWCCKLDGRRGLERFASNEFARARRQELINYRAAVILEQERQRDLNESNADLIAKAAREESRRSRTFALYMGEADAMAAKANTEGRTRTRYHRHLTIL